MMIQKVNLFTTKNTNIAFSGRKSNYAHEPQYADESRILETMSYLGLTAIVGIGLYKYKKIYDAKKLLQITNLNKATAAVNVYSSASRNSAVVNNYYRDVAKTKLDSAQYKLKNGFFVGKSPKQIAHIKNNIEKLKIQAHMA